MKIINKILILFMCCLFCANFAEAKYYETECSESGTCAEGYSPMKGEGYCVCWKCEGDDCEVTKGVMKGCEPLPVKLNEAKSCKFCPLFEALFTAVKTMATQAFDKTKDPIKNVMLYGFALYMAFNILKLVSSMTKQDTPRFIGGLLVDTFKFFVSFLLLANASTIYYYAINPLLSTALDFGGAMLFAVGDTVNTCKTNVAGLSGSNGEVLPTDLYTSLECFIRGVQEEIAFAQAAGSSIMCVGMNEASGAFGIWDFSMVFSGIVIYVCALLLTFAFGFYLIDSVVMLGVIGALMTFFIACWPFKMTSGYTSKGFNMFMNIFFTFVMMGIVVSINTQLIKASLAAGGLDNLEAMLSGNNMKDAKEILDITGVGFLVILCCCFFGFKFTAKTAALASSMAGGGGIDIGAKLGGLLASGAVNSGTRVLGATAKPVVDKAKKVGGSILSTTSNAIFHPMISARKFAGVATKRMGQAQKAMGAYQTSVGQLRQATGMGGDDLVKKGSELYNKGRGNVEAGQSKIDREDELLYGKKPNQDYEEFNEGSGSSSDKPSSTANNEHQQIESDRDMNQNREDSKSADDIASEKFDNEYKDVIPQTEAECNNLVAQAQQDYMAASEAARNDLQALGDNSAQMHIAQQDMFMAQQKMFSASTEEQRNVATQQYADAEARYNQANAQKPALEKAYRNSRGETLKYAMAYAKYSSAGEQMRKGNAVDWNVAHKSITSKETTLAEQAIKNIENTGPRGS